VVGVDRPGEAEGQAGELALDSADHLADLVLAARFGERVGAAGVLGPQFADELAAALRVGLVPARDVSLGYFPHRNFLPCHMPGLLLAAILRCGKSACRLRGG